MPQELKTLITILLLTHEAESQNPEPLVIPGPLLNVLCDIHLCPSSGYQGRLWGTPFRGRKAFGWAFLDPGLHMAGEVEAGQVELMAVNHSGSDQLVCYLVQSQRKVQCLYMPGACVNKREQEQRINYLSLSLNLPHKLSQYTLTAVSSQKTQNHDNSHHLLRTY